MRTLISFTVGIISIVGLASMAKAINISSASVQNGLAAISGGKAAANSSISWEGSIVTTANKNGGFSFSFGVVPTDCVGTLSDGVTTIDVALLNCTPVSVAPAPVLRTGQALCVNPSGANGTIDCARTGQDGDIKAGVALPSPRFTDNGNGIVTDNATGLQWFKDVGCLGTTTWSEMFTLVTNLNSGADPSCEDYVPGIFHDWRVSNINELHSLINYGFFLPAISNTLGNAKWSPGDPFVNLPGATGTISDIIFSSTPVSQNLSAMNTGSVWAIRLAVGQADTVGGGTHTHFVWPVRGPK